MKTYLLKDAAALLGLTPTALRIRICRARQRGLLRVSKADKLNGLYWNLTEARWREIAETAEPRGFQDGNQLARKAPAPQAD